MSRAGKYPVEIASGVTVEMTPAALNVKGPKGSLSIRLDTKNAPLVDVKIDGNQITVTPKDADDKASRAMWGTMTRNIKQAIIGVTTGFQKDMGMKGVGFKAAIRGKDLVLVAGYSHEVVMPIPEGLTIEMGAAPTEFSVKGMDKNLVGQFADKIRKVRKPEPYKGKGIFYKGEKIRRKEGKKK
ncbi:MAG: 50S ribosomal protein L6 [Alphaproteobacteria bacterium]|nr:50S ribosomal protein L6 [Alphaproteobacteria bacterium]